MSPCYDSHHLILRLVLEISVDNSDSSVRGITVNITNNGDDSSISVTNTTATKNSVDVAGSGCAATADGAASSGGTTSSRR